MRTGTGPAIATTLEVTAVLTNAYTTALPHTVGLLTVVANQAQVDARVAYLRGTLTALGVDDVTQEGRLVLDGSMTVEPGVTRGVPDLPPIATHVPLDLDTFGDLLDYTTTGRRRGSTVARTLVAQPSSVIAWNESIWIADEIQFQDGMELVIGPYVKYLTIIAKRIIVGTGVTITWDSGGPAPDRGTADAGSPGTSYLPNAQTADSAEHSPDGGDGHDGDDGDPGYPGEDAPTLEIWALDCARLPEIALQGGKGGTGQTGGAGGGGGHGAMGLESHGGFMHCEREVGYGGDGGNGGEGGDGGDGGTGGTGGDLVLYLTDTVHEAVLAAGLVDNRAGGRGGDAGTWGIGGGKGYGGSPGDPSGTFCHPKPERGGLDGTAGSGGDAGVEGPAGATGQLTAVVITDQQFLTKWTSPQVRSVSPAHAEVGATVTINGANFTSTATVRIGALTAGSTYVSDVVLQAEVPALPTGWADVVVEIPGGETSNPGSLLVLPTMIGASPNPARLGATITIFGAGFQPGCHVLFRGAELDPSAVAQDGTTVQVTLPAPAGPFEDHGGIEPVFVRNPDGIATEPFDLVLRHVLSTGFDVTRNGYAFLNTPLAGLADLGTFTETYGAVDVDLNFLLHPVVTGAWYAYYRSFFNDNTPPGYSSGFSTTAADEYWSGNPDLHDDHAAIGEVERLLTVAQGHVLSQEMLTLLAGQALAGVGRAERSLDEVEAEFRNQIGMTPEARRTSASIMQLMPAGSITTTGFVAKLTNSHGLLPIRLEWPVAGEPWEKQLVVYDNAGNQDQESQLVFTRDGDGLLRFVLTPDQRNRTTATGWTLSQASLYTNWLSPKTLPLDFVFLLSPATMLVEDDRGRKFGIRGADVAGDLPGAFAAIGAPNLYLLPLDRDLSITISGTGEGTYTFGVCSRTLGRSVTLTDVPVQRSTRDVVRVRDGLREFTIESAGDGKDITAHYGVGGPRTTRALSITAGVGSSAPLSLRSQDNLDTFEIDGGGPGQQVAIELAGANSSEIRRQRFAGLEIGGSRSRTFQVTSWADLAADSLQPVESGGAVDDRA